MIRPQKSRFVVRLATSDDLSPCLALDRSLETQLVWQIQMREEGDNRHIGFQTVRLPRAMRVEYPRDETALRTDLSAPEGILVAESEGIVLGFAQVSITVSDKSAALRNLVVDAPWRRHRVGRALLDQAKGWAVRHGANHITLETTTRSYPSIRFMLDRGLIFCGFNDRYYASQDIAVFFGQNL